MANKDRQKRSVRQARSRERAEREATLTSTDEKKVDTAAVTKKPKAESNGFFSKVKNYFKEVRSELKRVVWPSKPELKNYSVAIICALIVFGVCVWLVDTGFVSLLVLFTGLRG